MFVGRGPFVFLENLTKEIIVSVAMVAILLFSFSRRYRGGFFFSALVYGVLIRPYWILFSLAWVGVCVMKKYVSRLTFFLMLFLFYLAVATAIQLVAGYSVSSIRASNNELRTAGEEGSKSLIVSWLSGGDFVSQALDSLIIFFRLSFPAELILLSGLGQIIFVVLMMMTSLLMFKMITSSDYKGVRIETKVKELIAIPLSFYWCKACLSRTSVPLPDIFPWWCRCCSWAWGCSCAQRNLSWLKQES